MILLLTSVAVAASLGRTAVKWHKAYWQPFIDFCNETDPNKVLLARINDGSYDMSVVDRQAILQIDELKEFHQELLSAIEPMVVVDNIGLVRLMDRPSFGEVLVGLQN